MKPTIAIFGCDSDPDIKRVFRDLGAILELNIEFSPYNQLQPFAGIISMDDSIPIANSMARQFKFIPTETVPASSPGAAIGFSVHPALPHCLQGQKFFLGKESAWQYLEEAVAGDVIATINNRPVWKITHANGFETWMVSTPIPRLRDGQRVSQLLNGETFLPLLPLYLFLCALSPESSWEQPPLRACMVVDDPNLHGRTYGHVDFRSLVELSQSEPFHAAMATVPMDAWWINSAAAKIFAGNPDALSLLVHGNNHLHYELARDFQNADRNALAVESLSRIEFLERRAQVHVDRVMAPPHGVCAPEMFGALRNGGYDGLTTNRWSLWKHNAPEQLSLDMGLRPADFIGGLPVLNRFRFRSPIYFGEAVIAALLGQPIIPYGHHQDFANEMISVREVVSKINSIGTVRWMSLRGILETNFQRQIESDTLRIRLFSRNIKLKIPDGVESVRIEEAPSRQGDGEFDVIIDGERIRVPRGTPFAASAGAEMEIREVIHPASVEKRNYRRIRRSPVVRLRRVASELRDRLRI